MTKQSLYDYITKSPAATVTLFRDLLAAMDQPK